MLIHLTLFILPFLGGSDGDTFTSIREMENLFDIEQELVKALDSYLKHANFETEIMEMHYKELSKIESEIGDIDKYAENPVNAYSVIKRMHNIWPVTFKLMSSSPFFDEKPEYPDESALSEAIARLIEWQTKNKLQTKVLARGLHEGIMPHANLTATDCLEIAKYCYRKDKSLTVEWLQEALTKLEEGGGGSAKLLTEILEYIFLAKCQLGDLDGSTSALKSLITDGESWYTPSATLSEDYKLDKVVKCKAAAKTKKTKTTSLFKRYDWSTELCNSHKLPTKVGAGECTFVTDWENAIFLKYESIDGGIEIIHDFLTQDLIIDIKQSAMEEFLSLKTKGLNGPVPLTNQELSTVLNKRINSKMGLMLTMLAEDHQIFIHGPGGKQESLKSYRQKLAGKRFGTLYYFLSDVAQGGNIVFPDFKVSIEATIGKLVVWTDIDKDLDVKDCPVIVGSKWAMTQSVVRKED